MTDYTIKITYYSYDINQLVLLADQFQREYPTAKPPVFLDVAHSDSWVLELEKPATWTEATEYRIMNSVRTFVEENIEHFSDGFAIARTARGRVPTIYLATKSTQLLYYLGQHPEKVPGVLTARAWAQQKQQELFDKFKAKIGLDPNKF